MAVTLQLWLRNVLKEIEIARKCVSTVPYTLDCIQDGLSLSTNGFVNPLPAGWRSEEDLKQYEQFCQELFVVPGTVRCLHCLIYHILPFYNLDVLRSQNKLDAHCATLQSTTVLVSFYCDDSDLAS